MVKTYNGKSPRNARIKIDYKGESPSVNFQYPRKDGFVGSMLGPLCLWWFLFIFITCVILSIGIDIGVSLTLNETLVNETIDNQTNLENNTKVCSGLIGLIQFTSQQKTFKERLIGFYDFFKESILVLLILFAPPILVNKLFRKQLNNLFPKYQAVQVSKKYVRFKNKDIKITKINGKKEIYLEIPYFKNIILKYNATKDFSKYLDSLEIMEHNFKTMEDKTKKDRKKKDKKKSGKILKQNEWYWGTKFYFNKVPEKGFLDVVFK